MSARAAWLDGKLVTPDEARASVLSHAMQRGSLVFDVGALRDGANGTALLFRPREHVARFLRSATLIGLEIPYSAPTLLAATVETVRASGVTSALVRWSAFVAALEPDVVPRLPVRTSVLIAVIGPGDYGAPGEFTGRRPLVSHVSIPRDFRKAGPEVLPPQAKVAASYLGPMLAKRHALAQGFDDVLLLDAEGLVAEAPTANVFAVIGGGLLTPPTTRVLSGITRDAVLALARAEKIPAREADLTPAEISGADEAFFTATSLPVQAIASFDREPLRLQAPGPITRRIQEALAACERGADPRFLAWTETVR
jgi:branched-chain amino acid aminotransferase